MISPLSQSPFASHQRSRIPHLHTNRSGWHRCCPRSSCTCSSTWACRCSCNRSVDTKNLAKEVQTTRPILEIYFWRCSCTCARARPETSRPGNRPRRLRREKDGRELGACCQLCFAKHCQHLHYQPLKTATHNHHDIQGVPTKLLWEMPPYMCQDSRTTSPDHWNVGTCMEWFPRAIMKVRFFGTPCRCNAIVENGVEKNYGNIMK